MKTQSLETKGVPSKDEVTETPEEKKRREYMEILNIGLKIENGEKLSDKEKKDKSDDIKTFLAKNAVMTDFVPDPDNQAIHFSFVS